MVHVQILISSTHTSVFDTSTGCTGYSSLEAYDKMDYIDKPHPLTPHLFSTKKVIILFCLSATE